MLKNYFYCSIVLTLILGCGEPPIPMPPDELYKTPPNTEPLPLGKEWEKILRVIDDKTNKENLASNIRELKKEHRDKILEILNIIPAENQQIRFVQDISSFNKQDQSHLINILLYLEERNKPLVLKLVSCFECLSVFEKLRILNIIHDLDKASQHLIDEFEDKLEEETE